MKFSGESIPIDGLPSKGHDVVSKSKLATYQLSN